MFEQVPPIKNPSKQEIIYTIGHSTDDLAIFIALLDSFGIEQLVDVRTIPRSRHNPQFNFETFATALRNKKINYRHEKALGGLRRPLKNSINTAWRNASFRAYADYMQSQEFINALDRLLLLGRKKPRR